MCFSPRSNVAATIKRTRSGESPQKAAARRRFIFRWRISVMQTWRASILTVGELPSFPSIGRKKSGLWTTSFRQRKPGKQQHHGDSYSFENADAFLSQFSEPRGPLRRGALKFELDT